MGRFNPHPTRRPGATPFLVCSWPDVGLFQSPPDPEAGCDEPGWRQDSRYPGFNPHPTRRPGATAPPNAASHLRSVSIPTRPGGRVRRADQASRCGARRRFNPHPTRRPGATRGRASRAGGETSFNPHPTRRPGATARRRARLAPLNLFQSPPDPEAGCDVSWGTFRTADLLFQSPPDPEAGCDDVHLRLHALRVVSIPTRPGGRVRRWRAGASPALPIRFNPHPTRRPGATAPHSELASHQMCFNPHPTRRPGATPARTVPRWARSFQSPPDPEAGCDADRRHHPPPLRHVSIPTRPGGRVRRLSGLAASETGNRFQSPPDPEAGCDLPDAIYSYHTSEFQSPPDPEAGCDHETLIVVATVPRFQSPPDPEAGCDNHAAMSLYDPASFNPHPTRRPGATTAALASRRTEKRTQFQSPPDPEAGCDFGLSCWLCYRRGFQSPPDPEAGCDGGYVPGKRVLSVFQSPPDPEAGCDAAASSISAAAGVFQSPPDPEAGCDGPSRRGHRQQRVSIPTRPGGRVRRGGAGHYRQLNNRFNPHPTRRPGATSTLLSVSKTSRSFNPHPTRRPGATLSFAIWPSA